MPAIGISTLHDYTEPTGCFLEELSVESTVEERTIRNKSGVTVEADTLKYARTTRVAKGRGNEDMAAVSAGGFTAGTYKVTGVKNGEQNDDFSTFEQTAVKFENLEDLEGEEID